MQAFQLDLSKVRLGDLASPEARSGDANRLVVAGLHRPVELVLELLAREIRERRAHRVDDLAQRVFDDETPMIDALVGGTNARAALEPHVDHLADRGGVHELRKRRRVEPLVLRISVRNDDVTRRVAEYGIGIYGRPDAIDLRSLDIESAWR